MSPKPPYSPTTVLCRSSAFSRHCTPETYMLYSEPEGVGYDRLTAWMHCTECVFHFIRGAGFTSRFSTIRIYTTSILD